MFSDWISTVYIVDLEIMLNFGILVQRKYLKIRIWLLIPSLNMENSEIFQLISLNLIYFRLLLIIFYFQAPRKLKIISRSEYLDLIYWKSLLTSSQFMHRMSFILIPTQTQYHLLVYRDSLNSIQALSRDPCPQHYLIVS